MTNVRVDKENMELIRSERETTGASHQFIVNKAIREYFNAPKAKAKPRKVSEFIATQEEKRIVDELNLLSGRSYTYGKSVVSPIRSKLKDYTIDDCLLVVRNKCREWRNDPKMDQYLRTQTLFNGKFESYLNARPPEAIQDSISASSANDLDAWQKEIMGGRNDGFESVGATSQIERFS